MSMSPQEVRAKLEMQIANSYAAGRRGRVAKQQTERKQSALQSELEKVRIALAASGGDQELEDREAGIQAELDDLERLAVDHDARISAADQARRKAQTTLDY